MAIMHNSHKRRWGRTEVSRYQAQVSAVTGSIHLTPHIWQIILRIYPLSRCVDRGRRPQQAASCAEQRCQREASGREALI